MLNFIKTHLVADWKDAHKWASVRLHAAAIAIATLYQVMPVLDPQIASMLPAPLVAKAIGLYATLGILARVVQIRSAAPPAPPAHG